MSNVRGTECMIELEMLGHTETLQSMTRVWSILMNEIQNLVALADGSEGQPGSTCGEPQ